MELNPDTAGHDPVVPAALVAATMLILPDLQTQPWWLVLPCLICLILRWHTLAVVLLLVAMSYADTWVTGAYYTSLVLLLLTRMYSDSSASSTVRLASALRQVLLALPLLIVIILLAIGAGWSGQRLPSQSMTGVSDSMTPGSVSELVNDGDLAMRVRFAGDSSPLPRQDLYWRGIVLEDFDGHTWSRSNRLRFDLDPLPAEGVQGLTYEVTLEPSFQFWLYGLHQAYTSRAQSFRDERGMLVTSDMLRQRVRYAVTSIEPPVDLSFDDETRRRNLAVPASSNPRTQQWVGNLRAAYPDDRDFTTAILRHFSEQPFFYTLTPARGSGDQIDDFMFGSRQGYCEHYAGALTFILRVAGIPARVVAGYQGGDFNPITGHWTVNQYNAHAWVEAWLPDSGWQRLDPTTAVAPERIDQGIDAWLASLSNSTDTMLDRGTRQRLWLATYPGYQSMSHSWDALQFSWNMGVYDSEGNLRSDDLNDWLAGHGLSRLPIWLLAALLVFVGVRASLSGRQARSRQSPVIREYQRLDSRLRKLGLARRPAETMAAHLERVGTDKASQAEAWKKLGSDFTEAEYRDGMIDRRTIRRRIRRLLPRALFRSADS